MRKVWMWICAGAAALGTLLLWAFTGGMRKERRDDEEAGREKDRADLRRAVREGDDAEIERLWRKSQRRQGKGK